MTPRRHRYRPLLPLLLTCLVGPVQAAFTDNGDGTVTDTVTGLMWDQCSWGQTFDVGAAGGKCAGGGSAPDYGATGQNWAASLTLAKTANAAGHRGHNDWRLPNRTELMSLVNYAAQNPAIDGTAFPNTPSNFFWSSTVYAPYPAGAWDVFFNNGGSGASLQTGYSHVRLVRSGQSFGAFDRQACGDGIPYTTGAWQMLALPCVTLANPATPASVFGGSPGVANLDADDYNISTGWAMYRREVGTTPSSYVKLDKDPATANLTEGGGYWLKSLSAAANSKITAAGTGPVAPDVSAPDCASANGCKAIALTTVSGQNRYNLVGNPFPYAIDWSKVRVRVGGSGGTVYSPCQAFGVLSGDCTGPAASVAHPPVIDNAINIWECTPTCDYHVYSDLSPDKGNLKYFMSFWVNVLPGAFEQTVELLIPAEASTLTQAKPAALPWYLAWLDWIASPAEAASQPTSDWWVSLKLKNHVNGGESGTVRLGQLGTAQAGYDAHDLPKLAPFAAP